MRLTLTVVDPYGGGTADVVLDADPESTVGDIAQELAKQVGHSGAQVIPLGQHRHAPANNAPLVYVDGYAVDPNATVVGSPLREGAVVSLQDPSGCLPGEPTGLVELRVVGGPAAGFVHRLGVGRYDIGSGAASYIRLDDPEVDARALTLSVATDGTCQVAVHSDKKHVTLDGTSLAQDENGKDEPGGKKRGKKKDQEKTKEEGKGKTGPTEWPLGAQIGLGNTLLELTRYTPPNAALKWSDDGVGLDYNRPPRLRPPERQTSFRLPSPPREYEARPLPWLMALTPLVGAVVSVMIFQRWYYLIMAGLSPILLFANYYNDKKHGRKSHAKQVEEYEEQKERIEKDAQDALVAERNDRRHAIPDPATVLALGTGPRTRLWERRRTDRDHLLIRFGTGQLPSEVVLDDPEQDDHRRQVTWKIEDAPVALHLRTLGVVGMAGPGDSARALGRWAVAQTAALHSPMDVQFYVLSDNSAQESWDWMRWLPHARRAGRQRAHRDGRRDGRRPDRGADADPRRAKEGRRGEQVAGWFQLQRSRHRGGVGRVATPEVPARRRTAAARRARRVHVRHLPGRRGAVPAG